MANVFMVEELPKDETDPSSANHASKEGLTPQPSLPKKVFSKKYIDEVYLNLVNIKKVAFEYCQKIWDMSNEKVDSILSSQDFDYIGMNPCSMAKVIINKTEDEDLVTSVHAYIVSIRNSQLFAITTENVMEIDFLLDEKRRLG